MDIQGFITELGGSSQIARELGVPMTTVAAWRQKGRVPHWRIPALVALAVKKGKPIPPALHEAA